MANSFGLCRKKEEESREMGWVWNSDDGDINSGGVNNQYGVSSPRSGGDQCSTRRIVRSQCKTEEVEPGKFIRKCEKTEELLKDCVGRPTEVVQSDKEYTEEDVTEQVLRGSSPLGIESSQHGAFNFPGLRSDMESFNFPGLKSDIEAIERNIFGGMNRIIEAAEDMANGFFGAFGAPNVYDRDSTSSPSNRRGMPIDDCPQKEASPKLDKSDGEIDLSGLAKDV